MAREDDQPTDKIIFSWNEGLTWETIIIDKFRLFMISNISTEPSNSGYRFIIDGIDDQGRSFIYPIDFSNLHDRDCWGAWDPTMQHSDYHLWPLY